VNGGHVYLAVPKTKRTAGLAKTNGFRFGRKDFEFFVIPLAIIAALFLL
jgi:hypothetical protein